MNKKWPAIYLAVLTLASLGVAFLADSNPDGAIILLSPTWEHIFGTDSLGRDLLNRVLNGTRLSLFIGVSTTLVAFVCGITFAFVAFHLKGWRDQALMRFAEILMALPQIVLIAVLYLAISTILENRSLALILALSASSWPWIARQVRNWIDTIANEGFVEAANALGASKLRVSCQHLLPNLMPNLIVFIGLQIPQQLLFESFLSFVGIGIQPPEASWGVLIQEGWRTLSVYPHLLVAPSAVLFLTVLSFNLIFQDWAESIHRKPVPKVHKH